MKKQKIIFFLIALCCSVHQGFGQKIVGDCTIVFKISAREDSVNMRNTIKNAYKKFYVHGGLSLTEISFDNYLQSTIYNKNGNNIYVMHQISNQKYLSVLSEEEWAKQFDKYKGAKMQRTADTLNVLGYTCKKIIVTLRDGTKINLYYTPELKTTVSETPYEFEDIDGLILKYEAEIDNKYKITYTATTMDFNPVPAAKFIVPKEGYRILE